MICNEGLYILLFINGGVHDSIQKMLHYLMIIDYCPERKIFRADLIQLQTNFEEFKLKWSFWLYQNVLHTYVFEGIFIYVYSIYLRKWYTISYLLCGKKKIVELHDVSLH